MDFPFSSEDLARIRAATGIRRLEYAREMPSTNNLAMELAGQRDLETPLLVLTDEQTDGRGRGTNRWWSRGGALTFTLVMDANHLGLPGERWPQVALIAGLAVCQELEHRLASPSPRLKWPNDVLLGDRKVCGVLLEVPRVRQRLVVGIGVNVNNSLREIPRGETSPQLNAPGENAPPEVSHGAPFELRAIATSLRDESGEPHSRADLLIGIVRRLDELRGRLSRDGLNPLLPVWRSRCYLTGREIGVDQGGHVTRGRCLGIDDQGALVLDTDRGAQRFLSGHVVLDRGSATRGP